MASKMITDVDKWMLEEDEVNQKKIFRLTRKFKYREGIFANLLNIDFIFLTDAERILGLVIALELLAEADYIKVIEASQNLRDDYMGQQLYGAGYGGA